jgi:hypothetical protein
MDLNSLMGGMGGGAPGIGPSSSANSSVSFGPSGQQNNTLLIAGAVGIVLVLVLLMVGRK